MRRYKNMNRKRSEYKQSNPGFHKNLCNDQLVKITYEKKYPLYRQVTDYEVDGEAPEF